MLQRTSAEKYASSKPLSSLKKTVEGEASSAPLDESTVLGAILRREFDPDDLRDTKEVRVLFFLETEMSSTRQDTVLQKAPRMAVKLAEDVRKASEASVDKVLSRTMDGATEASAFTLASGISDISPTRRGSMDFSPTKRKESNASKSTQGSTGLKGITEDSED